MLKDIIASIPEAAQMMKMDKLVLMLATSLGIDTTGLIKTPEELQEEQQQQMAMQLASQATPNLTKGMVDAATQSQ